MRSTDTLRPPTVSGLRVIVAETNTKDYAENGWPDSNDFGHALVTFATLGHLAFEPKIEAALCGRPGGCTTTRPYSRHSMR